MRSALQSTPARPLLPIMLAAVVPAAHGGGCPNPVRPTCGDHPNLGACKVPAQSLRPPAPPKDSAFCLARTPRQAHAMGTSIQPAKWPVGTRVDLFPVQCKPIQPITPYCKTCRPDPLPRAWPRLCSHRPPLVRKMMGVQLNSRTAKHTPMPCRTKPGPQCVDMRRPWPTNGHCHTDQAKPTVGSLYDCYWPGPAAWKQT